MKTLRASGGEGTWILHSPSEYVKWQNAISERMPWTHTVFTELVQGIQYNTCVQFYVDREGNMEWMGVTEQRVDSEGLWLGSEIDQDRQSFLEELIKPTVEPVAKALHEWSYFGVVGVDVLIDQDGRQYVIDINPRINGSTTLLLASRVMKQRGLNFGIHLMEMSFGQMTDDAIVNMVENAKGCEIMVLCISQKNNEARAQLAVFAKDKDTCNAIATQIQDGDFF